MKCPHCGKFCANVYCIKAGADDGDIVEVWGDCKTHGKVDLMGAAWSYEDFEE